MLDGLLHEQEHHRLQGRNRGISASLGSDVFVEETQGSRGLAHAHELMSALQHILRLRVGRRRRHDGQLADGFAVSSMQLFGRDDEVWTPNSLMWASVEI